MTTWSIALSFWVVLGFTRTLSNIGLRIYKRNRLYFDNFQWHRPFAIQSHISNEISFISTYIFVLDSTRIPWSICLKIFIRKHSNRKQKILIMARFSHLLWSIFIFPQQQKPFVPQAHVYWCNNMMNHRRKLVNFQLARLVSSCVCSQSWKAIEAFRIGTIK